MKIVNYINKIREYAMSTPDKIVFVDENATRQTTYTEFWAVTQKIASLVNERLQGRERLFVPIYLADSMEYFASELAIWMTGNAAVHMGLSFPQERVDYIMQHCEAEFLIDEKFVEDARQIVESPLQLSPKNRTSDQPCAMFYTSGSTGNPKGVLHSDAGFYDAITRFDKGFSLKGIQKYASTASCYFIVVVTTYSMMIEGTELHILAPEIRRDVRLLEDYIAAHEINFAYISPSSLRVFKNKAKSLRTVMAAGERLIGCYNDEYTVLNVYGQTETAGPLFIKPLDKNYDNTPIGRPTPGVEIVLHDENANEIANEEMGELCYSRGLYPPVYYKNPEETAALTAGGVIHTGDLVKRLPNGDLLYVQRKDWMVKINGQRVEPGEVETVMRNIVGVKDAIVKGFTTDDLTRQYLVGYYILEDGSTLNADSIKAELSKKVPHYMVPQYMVEMDVFPRNANNKIDRKSLLPPDLTSMQSEYAAPTNEVEKALCDIFASVLKLEKVGINDDFALLGGDSIRAMKIQQLFNEEYAEHKWGVLSVSIINLGHTPKKITEMLANVVEYVFEEKEDYPLNSSQKDYVLMSIAYPDIPVGVINNAYKLGDSIDMERLARAVEKVTATHKAFGIRFIEKGTGVYRQKYVNDPVQIKPEKMDEEMFAQNMTDLGAPFAVLNNPLFRIRIVEAPSGKYFLMSTHHSIVDGTSIDIILRDLSLAYDEKEIPEEIWSQLEVAQVEEQFKLSERCSEANAWFEKTQQSIPLSVPVGDVNSVHPQAESKTFVLKMTANALKETAHKMNATLNVYTTTVFARLMGKYCGSNKVAVWLPYASRDDYRTQNTVGQLVNGITLNTSWDKGTTLNEHLKDTNKYFTSAMSYIYADMPKIQFDHIASFLYQGEKHGVLIGSQQLKTLTMDKKAPLVPTPIQIHMHLDYTEDAQGIVSAKVIYHSNHYSEIFLKHMIDDFSDMLMEDC